jgi:hypothetical protein
LFGARRNRDTDGAYEMTDEEPAPTASSHLKSVLSHLAGTFRVVRDGGARLAEGLPGTLSATQTRARATTTVLQKLPDSTLRWLVASSVGLGAGLYLSGKRRLTVVAGVAPAFLAGAAMALRPAKPVAPVEPKL